MAFFNWRNQMVVRFLKRHSLLSMFFWLSIHPMDICFLFYRVWAEHKIFQKLQAMVPNLLSNQKWHLQLLQNQFESIFLMAWHFLICSRSKKVFLVHVQMIRKPWKVLSSTGSTHATAFYNQSSHAMLRWTVDSITLLLAPFSAWLVLAGTYLSEFKFTLWFKNSTQL